VSKTLDIPLKPGFVDRPDRGKTRDQNCNVAFTIFGGTAPLLSLALINATGVNINRRSMFSPRKPASELERPGFVR
jgi:hypothetical protein